MSFWNSAIGAMIGFTIGVPIGALVGGVIGAKFGKKKGAFLFLIIKRTRLLSLPLFLLV